MLQSMRALAHSWVVKALMLFLIVSFSIWGIGDIFRGNSLHKTVASVGNVDISVQELNQLFEKELYSARQKFDPNLTAQQARQMGLLDHALQREITHQLISMDIKRHGINVSAKAILNLLASDPQFRTKDGSFNKDLFRQILETQRMSEDMFIAQERQDLARQLLVSAVGGVPLTSQTEVDAVYKARAQKRILDVVTIDAAKLGGIPAPDDQALHAFYDGNPQLFSAPEYRSVTIATLSTDALMKDISVTDDQVKKEYEAKLDQLGKPERRDGIQVILQDENKAKQLAKQAKASGDLSAAAKAAQESVVPVDQLEEKGLLPDLSKAVFALKENGISDPVKTDLGWHVVQLKKIEPAGAPSFDKIKDKVREDMRRDQAIEAATRTVNALDDELAAGHSLDDIADGLKLRLIKISSVDANGLRPDGKAPAELPYKDQVLKFAFAQNVGEASPVEDDKAGGYFVVRTDDITPSGARPYDSVKDKVASEWKAHQQMVKAQAEAEKIVKGLSEGAQASSFDKGEGVSSRASAPLSLLGDTDKQLPQALIEKAFALKKGETATGQDNGKQIVIRLAKLENADASKPDSHKAAIENELKRAKGNELVEQYVQHLHTVFPVKTNAELLESMREREN